MPTQELEALMQRIHEETGLEVSQAFAEAPSTDYAVIARFEGTDFQAALVQERLERTVPVGWEIKSYGEEKAKTRWHQLIAAGASLERYITRVGTEGTVPRAFGRVLGEARGSTGTPRTLELLKRMMQGLKVPCVRCEDKPLYDAEDKPMACPLCGSNQEVG